jgi:hypothetical protein
MLLWGNSRTENANQDLLPILEIVLFEFCRLFNFDESYQLWDDETSPISVNDVAQGYTLGNCYLIAALAALAEQPDLIKQIFYKEDGQLNPSGMYRFRIYVRGVPTIV